MSFVVKLHPRVDRFLQKSDSQLAKRIRARLRQLQNEPFRYLRHHQGGDVFKLRIGEYRALVDVDLKNRVVFVQHLDHRKRIYKKR